MSVELTVVAALVLASAALLVRRLIGKAGIGRDRPDCGCGHCAEKRRVQRL